MLNDLAEAMKALDGKKMIFAPMLHVMSETNGNDSQTCVVCARDFLDDSLFCSTCASISFEGFGNFDNSDVFETQASFDDVLDDSGKFSGLEEFWKFRPGLVGNLTGAEDAAESTFLDLPATETCSLSQCLSVWSPLVSTFVSNRRPDGSVGMVVLPALTDCRWWFESLLVHSEVSSPTRRKATGDHKKFTFVSNDL